VIVFLHLKRRFNSKKHFKNNTLLSNKMIMTVKINNKMKKTIINLKMFKKIGIFMKDILEIKKFNL
jgi:hypothetical protein